MTARIGIRSTGRLAVFLVASAGIALAAAAPAAADPVAVPPGSTVPAPGEASPIEPAIAPISWSAS
jgi:hypothetical protein